ncbi:MAG: heavy metal-responsive transcriptional regulator [Acidimicrobiales bacterium]|nr:heavy metal-responsive transcriptional regulator [Acidimicrobiales bacterium]
MRIGELADQSGVTTKTIRFWESTGLLADPARTPSGYRDYDPAVVDRLSFIRHAQAAGLTLAEIRQILAISDDGEPPCEHITDLIHQHLVDVDERIRELTETRSQLDRLAQRAANQDPNNCDGVQPPLRASMARTSIARTSIAPYRAHISGWDMPARCRSMSLGMRGPDCCPLFAPRSRRSGRGWRSKALHVLGS